MKFDKFKSFLLGLSISAAIGYYLYQDVKTDSNYLRHELRKSHVEFKNQQMKASEFVTQVSETEKENIENYQEIVQTAKKYSAIVYNQAKGKNHYDLGELVRMHRKLQLCSDHINQNNKQTLELIKKYYNIKSQQF
ncbi:hypothetical protein KY312_03240 [Candidatus Woesearchaeota archaeon]|nr:hypothetical protein [Candidatus Woesearchaeota archaeon]